MTEKNEELIQAAIRLPRSMLIRADKLAESMSEFGVIVTRSEVLRKLVYAGFEKLEKKKR